jgi:hypothetical protein
MIDLDGETLTPKRFAAKLLAQDLCLTAGEWPPESKFGDIGKAAAAMTDREREEVGRHLRTLRDRCLRELSEELPAHWRRYDEERGFAAEAAQ